MVLKGNEYEVSIAKDGIEAIQKVKEHPPDLILLDIMMPGKESLEVCEWVKTNPKTRHIIIIMFKTRGSRAAGSEGSALERAIISPSRLSRPSFTGFPPEDFPGTKMLRIKKKPLNAKKILIADDNEDSRNILTSVLQPEGYEIYLAEDGIEALRKVGEDRPDLILLDIMMPGKNGFEVCESIRRDTEGGRISIIMISACVEPSFRENCLKAGADDYLPKPYDPSEALRRVRMLLDPPLFAADMAPHF